MFDDFLEIVVLPVFAIICFFIIALSVFKNFENDTLKKIDNLSNKENLFVYENCWKLENKYYCIDEVQKG